MGPARFRSSARLVAAGARREESRATSAPHRLLSAPAVFALIASLALMWVATFVIVASEASSVGRELDKRMKLWLASLMAGAFALRLSLATWGAGDFVIRNYWLASGGIQADLYHGSAELALWQMAFLLLPTSDVPMHAWSVTVGAFACVVAVLAVRELGGSRVVSLAAGGLLALQPLAIRGSGELGPSSSVYCLSFLAIWALARHRRVGRARLLVLFGLSSVLCAQTRPEAGLLIPIAGLAVLIVHTDPWRSALSRPRLREVAAVSLALAIALGLLVFSAQYEPAIARHGAAHAELLWNPFDPDSQPWLDTYYTARGTLLLGAIGALYSVLSRNRLGLWAAASLTLAAYTSPDRVLTAPAILCNARYCSLAVASLCVLGGVGFGAIHSAARRWAPKLQRHILAGVALAVAATSLGPIADVCERRTIDHEYRFVKRAVRTLPDCSVVYFPLGKMEEFISSIRYVETVSVMAERTEWRLWPPDATPSPPPGCREYFYRAPACSVVPDTRSERYLRDSEAVHSRCRDGMAAAEEVAVLSASIPAVPFGWEEYRAATVEIGLYELPPRESAEGSRER